ncbi:maleate cis-trans isomerase family protein [Leisingera sp. ANG-M1]|uniref:maleate cis-trans isomerase family protein n=1 Tax=Leisingera sp. ANG-M1 TaxID=1577895 RepID=UPI0006904ABC|nr:aspartate/glutamate racemase family protein [Leisingera sp. ANG-M1]
MQDQTPLTETVLGDSPGPFRVGVLALANDQVIERDLGLLLPPEVLTFTTRIAFGGDCTMEQLAKMVPQLAEAAQLLNPEVALDAVIFGCTSGTIAIGPETIRDAIQSVSPGALAVNPVEAASGALRHLGARRINLVTPYEFEIADRMAAQFEAAGFAINRRFDFGITASEDISRVRPEAILEAAARLGGEGAEATFISCTDFQSLEVLERIETETGMPTVSSNQAMAWDILASLGVTGGVPGYGRLLRELPN